MPEPKASSANRALAKKRDQPLQNKIFKEVGSAEDLDHSAPSHRLKSLSEILRHHQELVKNAAQGNESDR